jgi:hypothetical protein
MDNDYLWDKSGEPDATVQELEEVLGTLRYQPQPLILPEEARTTPRRNWAAVLAIAAAVALIAIALGIFLRVQKTQRSQPAQIANKNANKNERPSEQQAVVPKESPTPKLENSPEQKTNVPERNRNSKTNQLMLARRLNREGQSKREQLNAANRVEAEAAKEQLMLALRVVSAKLNFAQRKAVPGNNNVRYQHKVG